MSVLGKMFSSVSQLTNSGIDFSYPSQSSPAPSIFNENSADSLLNTQNQNNQILQTVAKNLAANAADEQTDSVTIFSQEIAQTNEQNLSKTFDKSVRVVFSKPAEQMSYEDYTRDYLRAMLRETGVSNSTDDEINRFQVLLKDVTAGNFGVEDKSEQAKMTERYRATQTKNGGEATLATNPHARALVLAGAGAIIRERVAAGGQLGAAQTIGQQKATEMALDIPRVFGRAAINTAEGIANTVAEIADPSIKTDPHNWTRAKVGDWATTQLPPPQNGAREHTLPRADLSAVKPEYKSDLMNRDVLTGKVNKDGLTVGKVTETAVELATPIVVGKAAPPAKLAEDARALFYKPSVTAVAGYPKGVAVTTKYGDIWYSPRGSKIDKALAINHERVHSALTPKLLIGREMRFKVMKLSDKSHLMRYMEEFLAESYAQIKVKGFKEGDLRFAAKFMLNNNNYDIKLSRVITEAAVATATIAGVEYGVYVAADAALSSQRK